jgi:hypothetical protein
MADSGNGWSFAGAATDWYITPLGRIISVDDRPGREGASPSYEANSFYLVPSDPDHELLRNIPWDEIRFVAFNRPVERPGTKVIARMSEGRAVNQNKPVIVYLDYPGGGRSVSYIMNWHDPSGFPIPKAFYEWAWHYDVLAHMIYWPAKESIPDDLILVHTVRELIYGLRSIRIYVVATIDFADTVGADLQQLYLDLSMLDSDRHGVDEFYNDNQMEECHALLLRLQGDYDQLVGQAIQAKNAALFWVFLTEWLAVLGTSLTTGIVIWSLLVKRRLYKEVGETRLLTYD